MAVEQVSSEVSKMIEKIGIDIKKPAEVYVNYSTFMPLEEKAQAKLLFENMNSDRIDGKYAYMALYKKDTKEFIGEAMIIGLQKLRWKI